jgi:hypothetical protein
MPRPIDKDLRDCLERANPYTEYRIEISQPDVVRCCGAPISSRRRRRSSR